ncbi:hypothetical protein IKE67_02465 [bacterium]|nr:hypothetical protein [bacterium]
MKKFLAFLICLNFAVMPVCAITDDFASSSLDKNLKIKSAQTAAITDEFVENTLDKTLKIKQTKYIPINDDFAQNNTKKNQSTVKIVDYQEIIPVVSNKKRKTKKVVIDENNMEKVLIRVKEPFTTKKQNVDEGDYIEFETVKDAFIKNKHYPKGTVVNGRIETISLNKSWGVPADLVIGNFTINETRLAGEINKTGANRSLWVYPSVYAGCLFFFAGLLLIPIRGGHAKLKPKETFVLYADK